MRFENIPVQIDNVSFVKCVFQNCTLVFGGGQVNLDACELNECNFGFSGAAASTLDYLKFLASNPVTKQVVLDLYQDVLGG